MDTENKRRAVVGIYGLTTVMPKPDGTVESLDKRQVSSLYPISANYRKSTFWIPVDKGSGSWVGRDESTTEWNNVGGPSGKWTETEHPASTWNTSKQNSTDWLPVNETED